MSVEWSTNEVNRALVNMWNRMSEEEKRHFEMSAFDDKDRIRRELEKVKQTCGLAARFTVESKCRWCSRATK